MLYLGLSVIYLWSNVVEGASKAPLSIATTPRCRGGRYFLLWITLGLVFWPKSDDPFVLSNPWESFSHLSIYHLVIWSKFNLLRNSQWITFPTQSCLVLYFFCASLLHSLMMWLIVSSFYSTKSSFTLPLCLLDFRLWRIFVLLLVDIQFFSLDFRFFAMSMCS